MNGQIRLRRLSLSGTIATVCIVFSLVPPRAAGADPPSPAAAHALQSKVSLADLDLSTEKGMRAAHKRLKRTAEHLCRQLGDGASSTFRWTYAVCVQETLADAIHELNVPAVAALDEPRAKH